MICKISASSQGGGNLTIWLTGRSFIWPPLRQTGARRTSFDDANGENDDDGGGGGDGDDGGDDGVGDDDEEDGQDDIELLEWSEMDWLVLIFSSWGNSHQKCRKDDDDSDADDSHVMMTVMIMIVVVVMMVTMMMVIIMPQWWWWLWGWL